MQCETAFWDNGSKQKVGGFFVAEQSECIVVSFSNLIFSFCVGFSAVHMNRLKQGVHFR